MALPVAEEEVVAAAVVRVERRVGHLTVVVARPADEGVEVAVAVYVRESGRTRGARGFDAGRSRDLLERAVAPVPKEPRRAERIRHDEVRIAVAVDVARGDAGGRDARGVRDREAGPHGYVREMPAAVVLVQDRPHAVAHEEVFVAVLVEVQDRDARARPDAVDEAVRQLLRRGAGRGGGARPPGGGGGGGGGGAEPRRESGVVEAWMRLDSVCFGREERDGEILLLRVRVREH